METKDKLVVLAEVLVQTKRLGIAERTFYKYQAEGLLPKGKLIKGRGKVFYFPADTAKRVQAVAFLRKEMGIPLAQLKTLRHWLQGEEFNLEALWEGEISAVGVLVWFALSLYERGLWHRGMLTRADYSRLQELANQLRFSADWR